MFRAFVAGASVTAPNCSYVHISFINKFLFLYCVVSFSLRVFWNIFSVVAHFLLISVCFNLFYLLVLKCFLYFSSFTFCCVVSRSIFKYLFPSVQCYILLHTFSSIFSVFPFYSPQLVLFRHFAWADWFVREFCRVKNELGFLASFCRVFMNGFSERICDRPNQLRVSFAESLVSLRIMRDKI